MTQPLSPEFVPPPPRAELLWAGIDLDGTLADSNWSPDNPHAPIGDPIPQNVKKALDLHARGMKLWIHTSRPSSDYEQIEAWCEHHGIPVKGIICGKPLFAVYIDDRNVDPNSPVWDGTAPMYDVGYHEGYAAARMWYA